MKRYRKAVLAGIVIGACMIGGSAWADFQTTPEEESVKEAFIGSQNISDHIGQFKSENGKTDGLSEEQIQGYIDSFNAQVDRYYTQDNVCRETYKETNEQILREVAKNKVCYKVDGGVLDCTFHKVSISEDGQTAMVKATYLAWGNWVEENENHEIEVTAPVNQVDISATMLKEDDVWKLKKIDEMNVSFAEDVIYELEEDQETASTASAYSEEQKQQMDSIDEYIEQTYLTEYKTFDEALAVAESLNPNEINPFELWWKSR